MKNIFPSTQWRMINGQRLYDLMKQQGVSQAELARKIGVSQQAIYKMIYGHSRRSSHLHKIAKILGTTQEYLEEETDNPALPPERRMGYEPTLPPLRHRADEDAESVLLPEVDIAFAMGDGLFVDDYAPVRTISIPKHWVRGLIGGSFDELFVARGQGDSMVPTIHDGDVVIVDTSQRAINSQDRVWAFTYGELGMIKRILSLPGGGLQCKSDNPAAGSFVAHDGEAQIIGRVIWVGRRI